MNWQSQGQKFCPGGARVRIEDDRKRECGISDVLC